MPPPHGAAAVLLSPGPTSTLTVSTFTFLNSLGTGVVTNGIFFLTSSPAYGFSRTRNYVLGAVLGVTYILAASLAGRAVALLRRRFNLSSRGVLACIMILMAALCCVPFATIPDPASGQSAPQWPLWLLAVLYSPLTGVLWPMVEAYVSGGRAGQELRAIIGRWNVVWSSAIVVSYWGLAPLIEAHATIAILALGGFHLVGLALLARFTREPAPHAHDDGHEPAPAEYVRLLATFRLLLPLSYIVLSTLGPFLPGALERLGVRSGWAAAIASVWLASRVLTFALLRAWHGWHGRWWAAIAGALFMIGGFFGCVLSPLLGPGSAGIACMAASLMVFGVGMAAIYACAIYYALEVGRAQVDAGGTHEALIGVGYTVGPAAGLAASAAVDGGALAAGAFEPVLLTTVAGVSIGVAAVVAHRSNQQRRAEREPGSVR
ncbi:MAG: hypothetical protein KF864_07650 [Phycisphaeraceae bacterium]|nr:hypothetical protein [Phycisphaeraceae bacterium]